MSDQHPPHKWFYCLHCDREAVMCGVCGNNTCNAGYGEVMGPEPGTTMPCPYCESAYELDHSTRLPSEELARLKDDAENGRI